MGVGASGRSAWTHGSRPVRVSTVAGALSRFGTPRLAIWAPGLWTLDSLDFGLWTLDSWTLRLRTLRPWTLRLWIRGLYTSSYPFVREADDIVNRLLQL